MGYAYIPITLQILPDDFFVTPHAEGHFDGDIWVEPERRYRLGILRELFPLPDRWRLRQDIPAITFTQGSIRIWIEGDEFVNTEGQDYPCVLPSFVISRDSHGERTMTMSDYTIY